MEGSDGAWPRTVHLIHFNDVYNVEEADREPKAGAARFVTALQNHMHLEPVILFSGDALNPSMISTSTQGHHMIPILNALNIDAAVMGNHDFDFGVENLLECVSKSNFPWLLSNIIDLTTGLPLANGKLFHIVERAGLRIGIVGIVEPDWIETLSALDPGDLEVEDFCQAGQRLAKELREKHECDVVIGLTHMRWPNDLMLGENVSEIDIVLGGHDHNYDVQYVKNSRIVMKSGTDFRQFSLLTMRISEKGALPSFEVQEFTVDSRYLPDPQILEQVRSSIAGLEKKQQRVLGQVDVELDGRFEEIRSRETNLGNFICDIILTAVDADLTILNSGSLRVDSLLPVGNFRVKELNLILPLLDPIVVVGATGKQILMALENGVSKWPALEGRFPQVGNCKFKFNPERSPGNRIDPSWVSINNEPLDLNKVYRLALKYFMATGKDGYDMLTKCPMLLDDESGPMMNAAVQNYFRAIDVLGKLNIRGGENSHPHFCTKHRAPIMNLKNRKCLFQRLKNTEIEHTQIKRSTSAAQSAHHKSKWDIVRKIYHEHINQIETETTGLKIAPQVEGRIKVYYEK